MLGVADFHVGSEATVLAHRGLLNIDPPSRAGIIPHPAAQPHLTDRKAVREMLANPNHLFPFGQRMTKLSNVHSGVTVGTLDGGLGVLLPIDERTHRRLALLQQMMTMVVETPCAMNPKEYRVLKTTHFRADKKKGVLDGAFLWKYVSLDARLQDELAASMGVTTDAILENLQDIDLSLQFF
jgi:CPSF A subunit region